jgi:hypothetical protein
MRFRLFCSPTRVVDALAVRLEKIAVEDLGPKDVLVVHYSGYLNVDEANAIGWRMGEWFGTRRVLVSPDPITVEIVRAQ